MNLGAHRGNWDASATIFGTYGNKIFNNQLDFTVFQDFSSNVQKDLLANSWTPTNLNAKYPRLDVTDTYSGAISSYYVEDGSYTRLRSMQVGYTLPSTARYLPGARVYLQGENLFTNCILVLDARTGIYRQHYSLVPADFHDWDLAAAPALRLMP